MTEEDLYNRSLGPGPAQGYFVVGVIPAQVHILSQQKRRRHVSHLQIHQPVVVRCRCRIDGGAGTVIVMGSGVVVLFGCLLCLDAGPHAWHGAAKRFLSSVLDPASPVT